MYSPHADLTAMHDAAIVSSSNREPTCLSSVSTHVLQPGAIKKSRDMTIGYEQSANIQQLQLKQQLLNTSSVTQSLAAIPPRKHDDSVAYHDGNFGALGQNDDLTYDLGPVSEATDSRQDNSNKKVFMHNAQFFKGNERVMSAGELARPAFSAEARKHEGSQVA